MGRAHQRWSPVALSFCSAEDYAPAGAESRPRHQKRTSLATLSASCFVLTLLSDLGYARTAVMPWANMSIWLLTVGLLVALPAVIAAWSTSWL
jgi:hypothetical protein